MAASAQMPRMSFGASNTLDLSLNLPIVLLPPSTTGLHIDSDSESDNGDDRRSLRYEDVSHDGQNVNLRRPLQDDPLTHGTAPRDTGGNDRPDSDLLHDPRALEAPTTPDAPAPVPVIPERNTRRISRHQQEQHHHQALSASPTALAPASAPAPAPAPVPPVASSGVPLHPIASMQAAFAESLLEVTDGKPADKPKLRFGDAKARREELISQERDEELYSARWRYRPGQQQHELHKLMAQISFGVYLLLNGMANSAAQVVSILQGHIDEVDEFLEVTMEDFQQASTDLKERIDYLRLPMENMEVFEKLLEDRNFRLQIVEGNEKIEHIVARTNMQLEQYDRDVQQGLASARDFAVYLTQQKDGAWSHDRPDVVDIYEAMKGNTEGWFNAFADLQAQGKELNALVVKLGLVVSEMSSKAGEVSRRTWASIPPFSVPLPESASGDASLRSPPSSLRSPPSSLPSPRSARRSAGRTTSAHGSAHGSSHSGGAQAAYFDIPMRKADTPTSLPRSPVNRNDASQSSQHFRMEARDDPFADTASKADVDSDSDAATATGVDDAPLYILQPRTYTPQPPEPLPSPRVQEPVHVPRESQQPMTKRTSLRQRVSLKTQPPDSIRIPPPRPADMRPPSTRVPDTPDSAYSDDTQRPRYGTIAEMSPPIVPGVMASPRSDHHQFYRPVQASPHSPLQQRPSTAGASPAPQYSVHTSTYRPGHQRNAPSRMGGASMLSNVTTMTYDSKATGATEKKLKKKRSAFGWLKKAFSLDEEERLAYESRRQQQQQNLYYDDRSPKYLDGRRVR